MKHVRAVVSLIVSVVGLLYVFSSSVVEWWQLPSEVEPDQIRRIIQFGPVEISVRQWEEGPPWHRTSVIETRQEDEIVRQLRFKGGAMPKESVIRFPERQPLEEEGLFLLICDGLEGPPSQMVLIDQEGRIFAFPYEKALISRPRDLLVVVATEPVERPVSRLTLFDLHRHQTVVESEKVEGDVQEVLHDPDGTLRVHSSAGVFGVHPGQGRISRLDSASSRPLARLAPPPPPPLGDLLPEPREWVSLNDLK